jgi:predicted TIM-barrel fold metal-dependent hydrolase
MSLSRRALLGGALSLGASGCFRLARPEALVKPLSDEARSLWLQAWKEIDAREVLDAHVHVVGLGKGGTGCWVNPHMQTLAHPILAARFSIYKAAAGVDDEENGDAQYVEVLTRRTRSQLLHGRHMLLAFDQCHDESGKPQPELSEFYTPNDYILKLARQQPELFVACASVHPYRADAVDELERAVEGGAVAVKWLPNAMRMDPSSARCDRFYDALARLKVPLLTHAGEEKAVEADEAQRFGNPLHLRRPLERGVRVIVAHCASLGQNPDLDAPGQPWVDNFELFARLMEESKWEGLLFGEVSAMCQANRAGHALREVMRRTEWHPRLVNGSDYPLPAINVLVQTRILKDRGFITVAERAALNELDQHNPLMFDFVLKRTLRLQKNGASYRLSPEIFTHRDVFPRLAKQA